MATILKKFFTVEEPQMNPEEMALAQMGGAGGPGGPPPQQGGQPPNPADILNMINQGALPTPGGG